ncbi:MAG: ferrous iron transport protein B, partial [Lentisphaeria bacterium]|nr:ferrous iron transport protein B [Lentisphaeria bacterium]
MNKKFRIALAGNPNCGKTCIFNALTGARQHVGNYPGVTVESKSGSFRLNDMEIELIDLPGVYSLSSSSPEESVVFEELTTKGIDLIVNVVDSTILQRSLYLTTQLAELHIPMLLAFNMSDDARKKGLKFDIPKLEKYFGAPIAQTVGNTARGVQSLKDKMVEALAKLDEHGMPMLSYGADFDDAIHAVAEKIDALNIEEYGHIPSRFFAIKLLEKDSSAMKIEAMKPVWEEVEAQILHLKNKHAIVADTFMADRRYAMLSGACRHAISFSQEKRREISDKIDKVITNKFLGFPLFLAIMYATFWFTFICADPLMGYIEDFFGWLGEFVGSFWNPETLPFIRSMVIDGIIAGVGGVIVFLPNILFLFFAIAILEESGYMSRAAFVMDGIMRKFGLQG